MEYLIKSAGCNVTMEYFNKLFTLEYGYGEFSVKSAGWTMAMEYFNQVCRLEYGYGVFQ